MISTNLINKLDFENLKYLDIESLKDARVLDKLTIIASDPIFELEPGKAQEFFTQLMLIVNQEPGFWQNNLEVNSLSVIFVSLSWKSFAVLNDKFRKDLLNQQIINGLKLGVDIKSQMQKFFKNLEFNFVPDKEERRAMVRAMENNQEVLGNQPIVLDTTGAHVQPTLNHWLEEYNSHQPLTTPRSQFNQINFINKDKSAQKLQKNEKEILKNCIELYDWLLFPPSAVEIIPEDQSQDYILRQNFTLPQTKQYSQEFYQPLPNQKITNRANGKQEVSNKVVKKEGEIQGEFGILESGENQKNIQRISAPPLTTPTRPKVPEQNFETSEMSGGSGLKFGSPDGQEQSMKQKPGPPIVPKPQANIDRKLEELKQKALKNFK